MHELLKYLTVNEALANAAYMVGLEFGENLKEELCLGKTIKDISIAMDIEHKIFGMKAGNKMILMPT